MRTILSCGKAFSFWRKMAQRSYISDAPSRKTKVCDGSNFPGTPRRKQLITSALIHRVASVQLPVRYRDTGLRKKVFERLPLTFNRLAGSMVYPHLD